MHKLVDYICDELEKLENKAEKEGNLSMAEVQYMDTLAHAKKNLLKGEEMMNGEYSMADGRSYENMSMARGRGANARRDSRGRYSSNMGRSYRNMSYDDRMMSYGDGMKELAESIYDVMDELPEDVKRDAHKLVKRLEKM